MNDDKAEKHQPGLTASALFAGFSFTAVLSLVMSGKSGTILDIIAVAFVVSTAAFIVAAIAMAALLEGLASSDMEGQSNFFLYFGASGMGIGFLAFTVGLGASGFLYSTWLGGVSVACSVVALISFVWLTVRLSNID